MHWILRSKQKDCFRKAIEDRNLGVTFHCLVDIRIDFFLKGRSLDSSNTSYMAKLIEDSLVKSGVLKEDNRDHVNWFSMRSNKTDDGTDYAILYIEEV